MKLTIAVVTGRIEPRVDWILEGLARQALPSDEIALVAVDALARSAGELGLALPPACVTSVIAVPPKPTPWQGPHKITRQEWWALSSSRNTAFVHAPYDFVAFMDDRCRLGPEWLSVVRQAELSRTAVVAGSYEKHENGKVTIDTRRQHAPNGHDDCGGRWLFGGTFCLPLEWALDVNGFEEGMDGLSFEDVIFGLMLENAGRRVQFKPKMLVVQERSVAHANHFKRTDKGVSPRDKSHASLTRFGTRRRTEFTPDLRALRARLAAGELDPWPRPDPDLRDWYDDQLVREMEMP